MNKRTKKTYTLISNNQLIQFDMNLSDFHKKVLLQQIGYNYGETHFRKLFKQHRRFSIAKPETGVVYWLEETKLD